MVLLTLSVVCLEPQPALCAPCMGSTLQARRGLVFKPLSEEKFSLFHNKESGLQRRQVGFSFVLFYCFFVCLMSWVFLIIIHHLKVFFFFLEPFESLWNSKDFLLLHLFWKGQNLEKAIFSSWSSLPLIAGWSWGLCSSLRGMSHKRADPTCTWSAVMVLGHGPEALTIWPLSVYGTLIPSAGLHK